MSRIGMFVKEAKNWLKMREPVVFILGNESCDLDSAVCALALSYFYMTVTKLSDRLLIDGKRRFLPLMNIHRTNLLLKTEVTYFLRKNGIDIEDLVCSNEIPSELFDVSKFILVDHHIPGPLVPVDNIIQIFDHRPLDSGNVRTSSDCNINIQQVGSCATIIANEIRASECSFENQCETIRLLRGPIILDTINFSEAADKAKPLDIEINEDIEKCLGLKHFERTKLFQDLVRARSDVSTLSALQLLSKDLKVISDDNKSKVVAIPGFPILVEEYMQKEDVWENLQQFGKERNCDVLILMGLKELDEGIRRDIGLVPLRDSDLAKAIFNALCIENGDYLKLAKKPNDLLTAKQGYLFEQGNIKASRKQILPIVQKALNNLNKTDLK